MIEGTYMKINIIQDLKHSLIIDEIKTHLTENHWQEESIIRLWKDIV